MSEQIDSAIRWGKDRIAICSESARLDAELLLAYCLGKPRSYLYGRPELELSESCWQKYQELVNKRLEPTPVAYLLGSREFYSMDFAATGFELEALAQTLSNLESIEFSDNVLRVKGRGQRRFAVLLRSSTEDAIGTEAKIHLEYSSDGELLQHGTLSLVR